MEGDEVEEFPNQIEHVARCTPVYESLPGWRSEIAHFGRFGDLPHNAQGYVRRMEELVGVPISHVLVGRKRDQTIVL